MGQFLPCTETKIGLTPSAITILAVPDPMRVGIAFAVQGVNGVQVANNVPTVSGGFGGIFMQSTLPYVSIKFADSGNQCQQPWYAWTAATSMSITKWETIYRPPDIEEVK